MSARRPEPSDLDAVLELMRAADIAVAGDSDWSASELTSSWDGLGLARDAWLLELDGTIAGYADVTARGGRLNADGYVHPVRGFRGMVIELEEEPAPASVPGIEIRAYRHPEEGPAFHAAHQESFADHWEHRPTPWEEWQEKRYGRETFDPTLWWVALDGEEIAGVVFGEQRRDPGQGWIDVLGVRRGYRRRGIAGALLKTAFAEFCRRGERKVGLGVDAESPTGAMRVYERAGMRTLWHAIVYEKELRAAGV